MDLDLFLRKKGEFTFLLRALFFTRSRRNKFRYVFFKTCDMMMCKKCKRLDCTVQASNLQATRVY